MNVLDDMVYSNEGENSAEGLIETAAQAEMPTDRRIDGVVLAQVVDNVEIPGPGRVFKSTSLPYRG